MPGSTRQTTARIQPRKPAELREYVERRLPASLTSRRQTCDNSGSQTDQHFLPADPVCPSLRSSPQSCAGGNGTPRVHFRERSIYMRDMREVGSVFNRRNNRRSFLKKGALAASATVGAGLLADSSFVLAPGRCRPSQVRSCGGDPRD